MRNILDKVRKRDYDAVKADALYLAPSRSFGQSILPPLAPRLSFHGQTTGTRSTGTAGLLPFSQTPVAQTTHYQHHRALLRRSAAPYPAHVCFVNVQSVDRIIYSIFQRFNLEWKTRTLRVFTQAARRHLYLMYLPTNNLLTYGSRAFEWRMKGRDEWSSLKTLAESFRRLRRKQRKSDSQ
jgi:hypothetical protein